ncbi:RNA polymerase sigma factor [Hymenobacter gummosus]|uniref:RNA polymerase sigma factor n=1 Tax=Hymenobacter gummosus TaxID=1776032 RepID=A0A431TVL5_9BACT|nr:RNA polymerase sigma factor [Hymenobacter gummosus]RTQ45290.1 RNA polymerase sigma factor [Hymenobacter gummosus]
MADHYPSDDVLMARVQANDLDQLAVLFDRYHRPIFNYLLRRTNNDRETAEDLTQTVFERLLKYRTSYQPSQQFRAWIYQLARNAHADHWQRQQQLRTTDVLDSEQRGQLGASAFAAQDAAEHSQHLYEALALLPDAQRDILVLNRIQGFSYEEIGEQLACSAGAARVKAHRALQALRAIFFAS